MNNREFSDLVRTSFEDKSKYNFLKKTNIVDTTEEELPESFSSLVIADVLDNELDVKGNFEFVVKKYPSIKSGVKVKDRNEDRLRMIADNLATACKVRTNELLALYMRGEGSTGTFYLKSTSPENTHITVEGYSDGIGAITKQLQFMESTYGAKYDRVTLNAVLLTVLTGEMNIPKAKKLLKAETGLKIDVDNGSYKQRDMGKIVDRHYVGYNKLILSNSKFDKTDTFYFANLPLDSDEGEMAGLYGVQAYMTEDTAWVVIRGIPILTNPVAFSSIKFI